MNSLRTTPVLLVISLFFSLSAAATFASGQGGTGRGPTTPTRRKKPTPIKAEPPSTVIASGEVRPIRFLNLVSEVAGRVQKIYVDPGDRVTKSQALVLIDSGSESLLAAKQAAIAEAQNARNVMASAQQALVAAEAAVSQARKDAATAGNEMNTSARELKRGKELLEAGVLSSTDYNAARYRYDQAKAKSESRNLALKEAEKHANQQRTTVKEAQTSVGASEKRANQQQAIVRGQSSRRDSETLRAPIDSVIADVLTRVGEVTSNNLSSTPLITIADMSTISVEVRVDATEIASVKVGQQVTIIVDAFSDKEIRGVVTQKNSLGFAKSDATSGLSDQANEKNVEEFKVTIELREMSKETREGLLPGMSATATIMTKPKTSTKKTPVRTQ